MSSKAETTAVVFLWAMGYALGEEQKLFIDPLGAPVVREIFIRYADGETARSIVEDFNGRELKTKKGTPFKINSLHNLLKNRKYIGEYSYQDVWIPGHQGAAGHAGTPKGSFDRQYYAGGITAAKVHQGGDSLLDRAVQVRRCQ